MCVHNIHMHVYVCTVICVHVYVNTHIHNIHMHTSPLQCAFHAPTGRTFPLLTPVLSPSLLSNIYYLLSLLSLSPLILSLSHSLSISLSFFLSPLQFAFHAPIARIFPLLTPVLSPSLDCVSFIWYDLAYMICILPFCAVCMSHLCMIMFCGHNKIV